LKLPRDVQPASLSRLPLLERHELDAEGQAHYDTVDQQLHPGQKPLLPVR
jgi:hypothetical protein